MSSLAKNNKQIVMKFLSMILLASFYSMSLLAQERDAYELLANQRFYTFQYAYAAPIYERLLQQKKVKTEWFYKLGFCYQRTDDYAHAVLNYKKFIEKDTSHHRDIVLQIGDLYKMMEQYDSAKHYYELYRARWGAGQQIAQRIKGGEMALYWKSHPSGFVVYNARALNSGVSDWGAVPYSEDTVVFMSDSVRSSVIKRNKNTYDYRWNGNAFYNLYTGTGILQDALQRILQDSTPPPPIKIGNFSALINRSELHIGPAAFTQSKDTVYFTQTYQLRDNLYTKYQKRYLVGSRRLEIFAATKDQRGHWKEPWRISFNNKHAYNIGHPSLNASGNIMYFTADMPGGMGGTDIWYSIKQADGSWGEPINCGNTINTVDEEAYPILHEDGLLYFASKGHIGMGGFDIFSSKGGKADWSAPINMGYPVNSARDDFHFILKGNGTGYMASNRLGGLGSDDIYMFSTPKKQAPVAVVKPMAPPPPSPCILAVKVRNKTTELFLDSVIIRMVNQCTGLSYIVYSKAAAEAVFVLTPGCRYQLVGAKMGMESDTILVEKEEVKNDTIFKVITLVAKEVKKPVDEDWIRKFTGLKVIPPKPNDKFILRDIYYDLNKFFIRPNAAKTLDTLAIILRYYPTLTIELSSHTDSRSSDLYNQVLSQKRAAAAVEYLVSKGINAQRLVAKGYGEQQLINNCTNGAKCTEEQHQQNRRTEVRVLKF